MSKKIILIGRAAVGKTSIRKVIFEGVNPQEVINSPLSPTRGVESSIYSWMDLELGLFDTAGQEIDYILREETQEINYFKNTNAIIYIFDYPEWEREIELFKEHVELIKEIIQKNSLKCRLILFFHKIDLDKSKKIPEKKIQKQAKKYLSLAEDTEIFFTSISPNYIYRAYNAFFKILGGFTQSNTQLKTILDKNIKKYSNILCLIRNHKSKIMVQSMTEDFDPEIIRDVYKKLTRDYLTSDTIVSMIVEIEIIDNEPMIQNIIKDEEEVFNPHVKNIILISKILENKKELIDLIKKLREEFNKSYEHWIEDTLFIK